MSNCALRMAVVLVAFACNVSSEAILTVDGISSKVHAVAVAAGAHVVLSEIEVIPELAPSREFDICGESHGSNHQNQSQNQNKSLFHYVNLHL